MGGLWDCFIVDSFYDVNTVCLIMISGAREFEVRLIDMIYQRPLSNNAK